MTWGQVVGPPVISGAILGVIAAAAALGARGLGRQH
jgi:hypothetical protein